MPWGISRDGTRAEVERDLPMLVDAAKADKDAHEQAMADVASETLTALLAISGAPRGQNGQRALDPAALDYRTTLNTSGHVRDDGYVQFYMSVTIQPPQVVGSLPDGPTPNELAAFSASRRNIAAAAERVAPLDQRPQAAGVDQPQQQAAGVPVNDGAGTAPAPAPAAGPAAASATFDRPQGEASRTLR
jgi:hypothetical protein